MKDIFQVTRMWRPRGELKRRSGVVTVGGLAVRWSRNAPARSGAGAQAEPGPTALESRLDDELRDLD